MATEMEKFVALGKEIGLEGKDLRSFVKEQQDLAREECVRESEAEKEVREAEREPELQLARIKADQGRANLSGQGNPSQTSTGTAKPKLPRFDEKHDDMDTFIERFERFEESQGWQRD